MNSALTSTISDVERETGLAKDTLRVWERRYNFPKPLRNAFDERLYPADQIQKLRVIKRLMDRGYRPGKIIQLDIDALNKLSELKDDARADQLGAIENQAEIQLCLALCKAHQVEELRRKLSQALLQMGLLKFVTEMVAPLTELIGESWATGYLAVFEEHLYTESIQIVLRNAISRIPRNNDQDSAHPRILLTTFPQERHGLGLLMAEALFALNGAYCISLGMQTPILEIIDAAKKQKIDIVALSFSSAMNARQATDGLSELRAKLPESIEVWAGGNNPILLKRRPNNIHGMNLSTIAPALLQWREAYKRDI